MKRTMIIVVSLATVMSMTACSALDSLLSVNIFSPFSGVSANSIKKASASELVQLSRSESFYATLAEDPSLKREAIEKIDEKMGNTPPGNHEYQELAALGANIHLMTTPAGELINNIGGILGGLVSGSGSGVEENGLETMMNNLLPPSVMDGNGVLNEASFIAMIEGLEAANAYYEDLGNAIGSDGYARGTDISPGDVAQSAMVSAMIGSITLPAGYTSRGEYLHALLTDDTGSVPETEFTMPDMETGPLGNIFIAAFGEGFSFGNTSGG